MNKSALYLLMFTMVVSFSSCVDYGYDYSYRVSNQTNSEIKIEVKTVEIDSIYSVSSNETKILFVTDHGLEGPKGPYFADVASDLETFVVIKNDTLISTKNYLDNASWNYNDGVYSTTVEENEFE